MENLDYGVIGNCLSAALVSKEGTIEWLCLPYFDSPSVFASILDKQNGGHFSIIPMDSFLPDNNILKIPIFLSHLFRLRMEVSI